MYIYAHTCVYLCMRITFVYACMHACMHARVCVCVCVRITFFFASLSIGRLTRACRFLRCFRSGGRHAAEPKRPVNDLVHILHPCRVESRDQIIIILCYHVNAYVRHRLQGFKHFTSSFACAHVCVCVCMCVCVCVCVHAHGTMGVPAGGFSRLRHTAW
jgi:hypothetical protein